MNARKRSRGGSGMSVDEKHSSGVLPTTTITSTARKHEILVRHDRQAQRIGKTASSIRRKLCRHAMALGSASCRQHPITAYNRPHEGGNVGTRRVHPPSDAISRRLTVLGRRIHARGTRVQSGTSTGQVPPHRQCRPASRVQCWTFSTFDYDTRVSPV